MRRFHHSVSFLLLFFLTGCGEATEQPVDDVMSAGSELTAQGELFFATQVQSFEPGQGAGFGSSDMPEVVLGAPEGGAEYKGSLDVVTLGVGGVITLGFEPWDVRDGPGVDFVVFENAFRYLDGDAVFAEPGEVSVSEDGERWVSFPCDEDGTGCAGMSPTLEFDPVGQVLSPELMGGDGFDLADVGLERVRYVRVRDRATSGAAPSAGFDLDAIAGVHGMR